MGVPVQSLYSFLKEDGVGCFGSSCGEVFMSCFNFAESLLNGILALVGEKQADLTTHVLGKQMSVITRLIFRFLSQSDHHDFVLSQEKLAVFAPLACNDFERT